MDNKFKIEKPFRSGQIQITHDGISVARLDTQKEVDAWLDGASVGLSIARGILKKEDTVTDAAESK